MHDRHRVLDRRPDHPGHGVLGDQRAGGALAGRMDVMDVQDGAAPVEFLVEGVEEGIGECATEHGRGHADADRPEVVEGAGELPQGGVDVGEGQRGEDPEASGEAGRQLRVRLVRRAGQRHRVGLPGQVRGLRGHREHLEADARPVHQRETTVQIGRGRVGADPALGARIGLPQALEAVEIPRRPQVGMHVDRQRDHASMERSPSGAVQPAANRGRGSRSAGGSVSWSSGFMGGVRTVTSGR